MTPELLAALLQLLITYGTKMTALGSLLSKAQAEGRDPTPEEMAALRLDDDTEKNKLDAAIAAAKAAGQP